MSTTGNLRLAFVIEAIDRATATVGRVNKVIDRITQPLGRVRAASAALVRESRFERVQAAWAKLGERGQAVMSWARGAGAVLLGLSAAGASVAFGLKRSIDEVDRLNDTSKKLGITTAQFQRLGFAAQMSGSDQEAMGQALQFLSQNMVEAINGSKEAAVWFERAGIPLARLRQMNVVQVMEAIADKFSSVGDAGQNASKKIALTRALMGRGGADLVQTLNSGSAGLRRFYADADELGGVVGQDVADAMSDFNDQFDRMSFAVKGGMVAIARGALPVLGDMVKRMTAWTKANREVVASRVAEFVERVLPQLPAFASAVVEIGAAVGGLVILVNSVVQALGGWETVMAVVTGIIIGKGLLAVYGLTTAVWGLGVALAATPFGWVAAGVAALAAGAALVLRNWEPMAEFFTGLWDKVQRVFSAFGSNTNAPAAGAPSIYASADEWARYRGTAAGAGAGMLAAAGGTAKADVSGTLRIVLDDQGRPRVVDSRGGGGMEYDVYSGPAMAGP